MKPASQHEATPGTPAEAQGIVTPQQTRERATGLAKGFELTPLVATPRGGVSHIFLKSRPHSAGRPYTIKMHGTIAARRNFTPMKTSQYQVSETKQLSSNLQGHDTFHNTPPVTAAVTEFNGNGDQVAPSKMPLILASPLAQLPMEQALVYMAQVDGDGPPAAVDADAACAFKRGLVRRRVMTVQWKGASFLTVSDVDVLWSPKSETGIVLDWDTTDEIYMATEIRELTAGEIGKAVCANYSATGAPTLGDGGSPMTVDRNLLPEEALIDLFADGFEGAREDARRACKAELDKCVQWVDHIDLN